MKYEVKDLNAPSRWNMRIWDDDNGEWLCQSDKDALTYYGFDVRGGETTEFHGLPKWHPNRHLIWEQSTGLKDKNGKEIYEGDIVQCGAYKGKVHYSVGVACYCVGDYTPIYQISRIENKSFITLKVIGNIHENPELIGKEEE